MLTLFVVSVSTMLVYEMLASTSRWPGGHEKSPGDGGAVVTSATTRPFFGSNDAVATTGLVLAEDGFLPQPLMLAHVAEESAVSV